MESENETRREGLAVEAISPVDGKMMVVFFAHDKLLAVGRRSIGQLQEAARTVPLILQHPVAVFQGLLREADEPTGRTGEGWLCYCGIPPIAYDEHGLEHAPWPGEVFMVFVSNEKVVYNWYWYKCDPDDPTLPEGYPERFRKRVL